MPTNHPTTSPKCRWTAIAAMFALLFVPLVQAQIVAPTHMAQRNRELQIATQFAPVIYQGIGDHPRGDYLTNFDFDGDWRGDNNWKNLDNRALPLLAHLYCSVLETRTHYFIHYAAYHARDYKGGLVKSSLLEAAIQLTEARLKNDPTGGVLDEAALSHENDLEGCLIVAEKHGDDPARGVVQYVETVAHNRFLKYHPANVNTATGEVVALQGSHALLFAEPRGHGMSKYTGDAAQLKKAVNGVLTYSCASRADDPEKISGKEVGYDLLPIYEAFWQRAQAGVNETFGEALDYGKLTINLASGAKDNSVMRQIGSLGSAFRGVTGFPNKARPPWGWFDEGEKNRPRGEWFFDPAAVIARHFNLSESFSRVYIYHPYISPSTP